MFADGRRGISDASTTRNPRLPCTRPSVSVTALRSLRVAHAARSARVPNAEDVRADEVRERAFIGEQCENPEPAGEEAFDQQAADRRGCIEQRAEHRSQQRVALADTAQRLHARRKSRGKEIALVVTETRCRDDLRERPCADREPIEVAMVVEQIELDARCDRCIG